jgi:biotin transport system permease protein
VTRHQGLFQTHVPGTSVVHRAPFALKLLLVLAVGATTFLLRDWRLSAVVLACVLAVHVVSGVGWRPLARSLRPLLPLLVVLAAFQWWSRDLAYAARVVLGILASFAAAGIVTATTPMERILDAVVVGARPLRRWVDPETVALTIAVMLRSIPWITGAFGDVREAARARGLERSPRALFLPVVVHTVAYARTTGDALVARGLGDPEPDLPAREDDPGSTGDSGPRR